MAVVTDAGLELPERAVHVPAASAAIEVAVGIGVGAVGVDADDGLLACQAEQGILKWLWR